MVFTLTLIPSLTTTGTAAYDLLHRFGQDPGTSFGGQAYPLLWHSFNTSCFAKGDARALLFDSINASLPMTKAEATPQEVSYTNMYLMSTVNAILMGEIVGGAVCSLRD
jgi:hypothetical protein